MVRNQLFKLLYHFHILFFFFSVPVQTSGQRTKREDGYHICCPCCCMRRHCGKWPATFSTACFVLYASRRRYRPVFCNELFTALTVYCSISVRNERYVEGTESISASRNSPSLAVYPFSSSTDCSRHLTFWLDRIRCCTSRTHTDQHPSSFSLLLYFRIFQFTDHIDVTFTGVLISP